MSPSRKVISSKVVQRKVLGSANPMAKGFRDAKSGCMDSVGGIFTGIIIFLLAFWPAWCSVGGVEKVSAQIAELPIQTSAEAVGSTGMVKIMGDAEINDPIDFRMECASQRQNIDVFWYEWELKEYKTHTETVTRTDTKIENGQEVEYTYEDEEEVQDWEKINSETDIVSEFSMGDIRVRPGNASLRINNKETCDDPGREEIGEQWLTVNYIPVDNIDELLVVGYLDNDIISGGEKFIITDMGDEALVSTLATEESSARTMLTILAVVMFFIAFNLIIGPLLFLLNYVPVIGGGLRTMIGIGSLILAIIWVLLLKFIFAFWWLIILIVIILVVLLVMASKKRKEKQAPAVEAAAVHVTEVSDRCPQCGADVTADAKFCGKCGAKFDK